MKIFDHAPPEFHLLVACCRWPLEPERVAALAAQSAIDWPLVARMARRHRVEGLAWHALKQAAVSVPSEAAKPLSAAAGRIAAENLRVAVEMDRLRRAFEEAGVPLLFVKGLSLGALAYGTILLKAGWDVDLLVPQDRVAAAAALLERDGYRRTDVDGAASPQQLVDHHDRSKESVWYNQARNIHVELHTALSDQPALLPGVGIESPWQQVEIVSGVRVPTLDRDALFAYLTVHGASSAWFRLKWLADVAALLGRCDAAEIARLYARAEELDAGRAAAVALLLCEALFEIRLDPHLSAALRRDRVVLWMIGAVRRSLAGRAVATELEALPAGTLWIHLMQLGLKRGLRYKLGEIRRQLGRLTRVGPISLRRPHP